MHYFVRLILYFVTIVFTFKPNTSEGSKCSDSLEMYTDITQIGRHSDTFYFQTSFRESDYFLFVQSVELKSDEEGKLFYEVGISNMDYAEKLTEQLKPAFDQNLRSYRKNKNGSYVWEPHPVRFVHRPLIGEIDPERISFSGSFTRNNSTMFSPFEDGINAILAEDMAVQDVLKIEMNNETKHADVYVTKGLDTGDILKKTIGFPLKLNFIEVDPSIWNALPIMNKVSGEVHGLFESPKTRSQSYYFAVEFVDHSSSPANITSFLAEIHKKAGLSFLYPSERYKSNRGYLENEKAKYEGTEDVVKGALTRASEFRDRTERAMLDIPFKSELSAKDLNDYNSLSPDLQRIIGKPIITRQIIMVTPEELMFGLKNFGVLTDRLRTVYRVEIPPPN